MNVRMMLGSIGWDPCVGHELRDPVGSGRLGFCVKRLPCWLKQARGNDGHVIPT